MLRLFSKKASVCKGIAVTPELFYMPIPKVACTSIKTAIYELKCGDGFLKEHHNGEHIHQYFERKTVKFKNYKHRVIVVRDPVKRFLSAFGNRVKFHGELNKRAIKRSAPDLESQLPFFNPNLAQFIDNFELYDQVPSIRHHCKSIISWVGEDLSMFTHIFPVEEIDEFERLLSEQTGKEVVFPRLQEGGRKIPLHRLTEKHLYFLIEHFSEDYRLLDGIYSPERIIKEWENAKRTYHNKNQKPAGSTQTGAVKHTKTKL